MALIALRLAAKEFNVSAGTLKRWACRQQVPAYKVGRAWKFDLDELKHHFKQQLLAEEQRRRELKEFYEVG